MIALLAQPHSSAPGIAVNLVSIPALDVREQHVEEPKFAPL